MTEIDELRAEKIVAGWFWQMAEGHNYRWKGAARTMTLFYESAPLESDVAQLVIEYLKSREGVTEFVIANKRFAFDNPWNAKDCWYQTMPGEKWAGTESTKVRVYWALVQAGDSAADGPYVVENGCKYKIEHSYFWDVASEPILPGSESGVQYSIQGFTRNRETGLFTYIVEKRETVQQDVPLYKSAETAFEQVEIEQHLGVKQASVASTGLAAGVTPGVRTERRLTKNPDCTTDIENVKHTAKKAEAARTVKRKTLRGTIDATTDRNLTDAEVAAKTASEISVGEMRTTEETAEELHDLTIEKTTPPATPLKIAESCEQQTSVHTDTKVEVIAAAGALPGTHVTAEANKEKIVSTRLNDDGVTADKTTTTREWKEKTVVATSTLPTEITVTTTKINTTGEDPVATQGTAAAQPNDHGSKTTQVSEITPVAVATDWITWTSEEKGPRNVYTYNCGLKVFRNQPNTQSSINTLKTGAVGRIHINVSFNRFGRLDGTITYAQLASWAARTDAATFGGSQERTIDYQYVYDYDISDAGGSLTVNPLFRTQEIRLRTYYGRGNEGSEAAAAALAVPLPPGLRVTGRTYIISPGAALMNGIIESIHRARVKLQTAYANGKAPAAANAGGGQ